MSDRIPVVVCLTTYNRVDCARISMEIIKLSYANKWPIVHACSDAIYQPYLEDKFVRCEPLPLVLGATNMLQTAVAAAVEAFDPEFIVHLEGDTWIFDQRVIQKYVDQLRSNANALIAASSWSTDKAPTWRESPKWIDRAKYAVSRFLRRLGVPYGLRSTETLSTQFFVARNDPRLVQVIRELKVRDGEMLEAAWYREVVSRCGKKAIIGMPEREPVHPQYRQVCEALTLYSQHWPTGDMASPGKRESLRAAGLKHIGPHMERLLTADDLSYYNGTAQRR